MSSLCGACGDVCPVKIDIPGLLVKSRVRDVRAQGWSKRSAMRVWGWAMRSRRAYRAGQFLLRCAVAASLRVGPIGKWTQARDLPRPPAESFRRRWEKELRDGS